MAENKLTLGYWNIRGLAQRIRLFLEYLQIPYEQVIYTPQTSNEWYQKDKLEVSKKNPAVNLPYLIDGDKVICESQAILVYLALKANRADLIGSNSAQDQVNLFTVMGVYKDLNRGYGGFMYGPRTVEQFKPEAIKSFTNHLNKIDGLLGDKQWLCSTLTYADFIIAQTMQIFICFDEVFQTNFPRLVKLQKRVWGLEGVKEYLASDRFKQRPINYYPYAKWY